jgi:alkylation response protein AidB-like acyl-CoA dehydrogenase
MQQALLVDEVRANAPVPRDAYLEGLTPEIATLRDRLRAFLQTELREEERRQRVDEEHQASAALRQWVRARAEALGLYRLLQPAELGGGGLGPLGATALHEEIAAAGVTLGRLVLGGDGGLLRRGTQAQQERLLRPVLRGERTAALAFTDSREGPRTTAVGRDAGFVVSGVKAFVTDGPHADLLVVVGTVTENPGGPTGSAVFAIPREAPGVRLLREIRTMDGAVHGEFQLAQVAVGPDDVIGAIGEGLPQALESITALRLRAAASACGAGVWALAYTQGQVARPHRSGRPLAEREQVRAMVADSATDLYAARATLYAAARRAEAGADVAAEVCMAKIFATDAVTRIVDRAIQLAGGAALVEDHPLARLYRKIRAWRIAEGATEVLRLTIARTLLSSDRSSSPTGG